ncbi:MAG: transposase [Candidatus Marinimicrobia bacterium]|nr:transposase [Candidatus Neomarinimicrobiota bacterium]
MGAEDLDMELCDQIQRIALEMPAYGYRRITHELRRQGMAVNHKRILRLMRQDSLLCLRKKKLVRTYGSRRGLAVYPNLVPELVASGLDQLWLAHITYIRLRRNSPGSSRCTAPGPLYRFRFGHGRRRQCRLLWRDLNPVLTWYYSLSLRL